MSELASSSSVALALSTASVGSAIVPTRIATRSTVSVSETTQSNSPLPSTSIPRPDTATCRGTSLPSLRDVTGLHGRVCQTDLDPEFLRVGTCCEEGAELRIQDNCTQYCSTGGDSSSAFLHCVNELIRKEIGGTATLPNRGAACNTYPTRGGNSSTNPVEEGVASWSARRSFMALAVAAAAFIPGLVNVL